MKLSRRTEVINTWIKVSGKGVYVQYKIDTCKKKWRKKNP